MEKHFSIITSVGVAITKLARSSENDMGFKCEFALMKLPFLKRAMSLSGLEVTFTVISLLGGVIAIVRLPQQFHRVGERKSRILYGGELPGKTATTFSQGAMEFVLTTYQQLFYGIELITAILLFMPYTNRPRAS